MRHPLLLGLGALGLLVAPAHAHAQWSARLALEAPLYAHATSNGQSSSFGINESFQPTLDFIASWLFADTLSLDLEFRRGIAATGTGYTRQQTFLGPGLTLDVPTFPLYGRIALPVQIEAGTVLFLRVGGGLKILDWGFFRVYFELTADLSCAGSGVTFFGSQAVNAALGAWLRF
jgi:hypothetical protein